jgi:tetratricopeptide (TPR) repeat protein
MSGQRGKAYYILGSVYKEVGLLERARQNYLKAEEDSEYRAKAAYQLGLIYLQESNDAEAIKEFNKAVSFDKTFVQGYNQLALIYFNTVKDYQRTVGYLRMSMEADPKQPGAQRLQKMSDALDYYIHAVLVDHQYLLPYVIEKGNALWREIKEG